MLRRKHEIERRDSWWSRAGAPWLKAGPICCSPFPLGVPQYSHHDPVSPTRSSNRTCGSPASGSRTGFTPRHSRVPTDDASAVSLARRPCGIPSWPWRRASSAASGFSGVFRLTANHPSSSASKAPRTRAPSLHRHYPASPVLWAPPIPTPACPKRTVAGQRLPHRVGLPCCDALFLHVPSPLPRRATRRPIGCTAPGAAAFPVVSAGRRSQLHFRGLLRVHSRYGPWIR
jgi:hypothetical protein